MGKLSMGLNAHVTEATVRVLYGDTDAAGIVYNGTYLRYFELGRGELMRAHDMPYKKLEELGLILPVAESYIRYKAPAHYDDLLTIKTCIGQVTSFSCRFHCHIYQGSNLIAKGFTKHAAVNRAGTLAALPDKYFALMQKLAN